MIFLFPNVLCETDREGTLVGVIRRLSWPGSEIKAERMVLGMVDSPLGPASLDATFIMVPYAFHHD